jgi:hypothetical protein
MTVMKQERAIRARDAILALLKAHGTWCDFGQCKALRFQGHGLDALYRTPFQRLPHAPEPIKYLAAMKGTRSPETLPYGLDVWAGQSRVLNIEWADDGRVVVVSYKPGEWEFVHER